MKKIIAACLFLLTFNSWSAEMLKHTEIEEQGDRYEYLGEWTFLHKPGDGAGLRSFLSDKADEKGGDVYEVTEYYTDRLRHVQIRIYKDLKKGVDIDSVK